MRQCRTVAVGLAVGVLLLSACTSPHTEDATVSPTALDPAPAPSVIESPRRVGVEDLGIAALLRPQRQSDVPNKAVNLGDVGDHGVVPPSVRIVDTAKGVTSYVGLDKEGQLCLVVVIEGGAAGSTCTTADRFARRALGVSLTSPSGGRAVAVLPDVRVAEISDLALSEAGLMRGTLPNVLVASKRKASSDLVLKSGYVVPGLP